jgi:hypothetical protein
MTITGSCISSACPWITPRTYLARANDPPPGNTVMWRGLSRLTDIALGAMVGAEIVGN